jgi:hypothetical protein
MSMQASCRTTGTDAAWRKRRKIESVKAGTLDAQENPFANTTTSGVRKFHRFHTATSHFYLLVANSSIALN